MYSDVFFFDEMTLDILRYSESIRVSRFDPKQWQIKQHVFALFIHKSYLESNGDT